MLKLRKYQEEAISSIYRYFENYSGNPLVVLPTGTGKSLVIASFIEGALEAYPETRIIVATHVKELVGQNFEEFYKLCPQVSCGVYSAGLGKRETKQRVLFVGIQSVYNKAFEIQQCDILLVDEAHTIPHAGDGMWRNFITDLLTINPYMKIVGLTATDYRLSTGLLTDGEDKIFDDVCYEYGILRALREGYLSPVIPKNMVTEFDVSEVHKRGGEYIAGELERAMNVDAKTKSAIDEIEAYGATRKTWLIFAAGNDHARAIHGELKSRGYSGACITQESSKSERDNAVKDIKALKIKYLVNNMIFTTGFNAPNIDMIACLRPTMSAGLWVQMLGRGMRLFDGKENCLVLDFAKNTAKHGPLDKIKGRRKLGKGEGDAPVKVCEKCNCICFAGCRICPDCGAAFPEPEPEISGKASTDALLSTQIEPVWYNVFDVSCNRHEKEGKPPSMRVRYGTMSGSFSEWVCFQHTGYARDKAVKWHKDRLPMLPVPKDVDDALCNVYPKPKRILVRKEGKFDRIVGFDFTDDSIKEITNDGAAHGMEQEYEIPL